MKNPKPVWGIPILTAARASGKGTGVAPFLGEIPERTWDDGGTLMSDTCIEQFLILVNHKKSWMVRLLAKRHCCRKAGTSRDLRHSRRLGVC